MNRITSRLSHLKDEHRKALSVFVTAGFPDLVTTVPLVNELVAAGADCIELGIPFSDPVADGPVIQSSSEIALGNGVQSSTVLSMARQIRENTDIPLILMGYANPVFSHGLELFISDCAKAGIDGLIIADLPPEESDEYRRLSAGKDIATIYLAAPTTDDRRLALLDDLSNGFLYCVSITGVTGRSSGISSESISFITRARNIVRRNPLLVGFGISTPSDAREIGSLSDGVIVGSALIRTMNAQRSDPIGAASRLTRSIRQALDTIQQ